MLIEVLGLVKEIHGGAVIPHSFRESWVGEALASRIKGD
jgi:hypothetical protein